MLYFPTPLLPLWTFFLPFPTLFLLFPTHLLQPSMFPHPPMFLLTIHYQLFHPTSIPARSPTLLPARSPYMTVASHTSFITLI